MSNISCNGLTDGSIDLTPVAGSGLYTYLWSTGSTTEDLSGLSAGTYSVVLTDTWGCTDSASFVITEPAALAVTINTSGNTTICINESRTLSLVGFASTTNTYQWSDLNGIIVGATASTYSATSTGTYSLTVTSSAGCITISNGIGITVLSTSVPSSLFASNIQLNKATMNWASVLNANHYDIRMRVQGGSWSVFINYISSSLTSKQKSNLQSATTYEWSIRSSCSSDTSSVSAWSSVQSFNTLTPCVVPTNTLTSSITLSGASLGWDALTGLYGYAVRYKEVSQPWSAWTTVVVTSNTYVLSGLTSGSTYHWQVRSVCDSAGINSSAFSSYVVFNTVNGCAKPINIIVDSITTTSAEFSWDSVSNASNYRLVYLVVGAAWHTKIETIITSNSHNISGLIPNENYRWRIRTDCNSSGSYNSGWTSWDTLSTLSSIRITAGDIELGENLNVYPNPTRGLFNISFTAEKVDNFEINIIDAFGQIVSNENRRDFVGEYTKKVDLSNWPRGIYMVQIKTKDSFVSKRIVLQ